MRRALTVLLLTIVVSSTGLMATTYFQDRAEMRKNAGKLFAENNHAEAMQILRRLVEDAGNSDAELPQDFQQVFECINQLGVLHEYDQILAASLESHRKNWRLLEVAADSLSSVEHHGYMIGGQFDRGYHRGGGRMVSAFERDRVQAVQLILEAIPLATQDASSTPADRAKLYKKLADLVGGARIGESWRLQDLTDFSQLPDYEDDAVMPYAWRGGLGSSQKGAPVDAEGNPVLHKVPTSWEAAQSDGERWRWALQKASEINVALQSEIDLEWADFLEREFGVAQDAVGPAPFIRVAAAADGRPPRDSGNWVAHELADTETIAKLASGVKRFALADEFNPIAIYRKVADRNDAQKRRALEALQNIRMNRHQYPQAAELLKQILEIATEKNDRDNLERQLNQILGNWFQFEATGVLPAGKGATFDVRWRNGTKIAFEAHPVNAELLLSDVKAYLQTRPERVEYERVSIENIGYMLVRGDSAKYIGEATAKWELDLQPAENHFDSLMTVASPIQKAGVWWITAKMPDGNSSQMVLWVADTVIGRKMTEPGTLYYIADANSGSPIAAADLEFFGWRQDHVPRTQKFEIKTSRFAARTDENGLTVPGQGSVDLSMQWLIIARTKDGRFAFDGFHGFWGPQPAERFNFDVTKVYSITDRPVYRPGHDVKFRMWIRNARFHDDLNLYADRPFWIVIRNPKGDAVYEQAVTTDRWSGADGEWKLPIDAVLGDYSLALCNEVDAVRYEVQNGLTVEVKEKQKQTIGQGSFRVEEYRKPEYEVIVDAPDKPVMLGEKIQAKISARYYFGAPVTEASVHYKVERTKRDSRWYPVARWDWLYSPGYWWFAPDHTWYPGWQRWGCLGPIPPWWNWNPDPPEIVVEGDAKIGPDGTFLVDIDTAAALANHSDSDHNYSITAEVVDQSRRTITGSGQVLVAREPFKVFVWTDRGHYRTGSTAEVGIQARTADGKPVNGTGKATLYSVSYESDKPVETEVQSWDVETDAEGTASLKMVPGKAGQFRISVKLKDAEGHEQEGGYLLFVRGPEENGRGYRFNDLELITEKREYQPGEKVSLQINTNKENSTVLLFVRAANGLCPQPVVLRLKGKTTVYEFEIQRSDMPNIFVEALTIADGRLHSAVREIVVPPEQRVANVEVIPSAEKYRPGAEAKVRLKLTDVAGKPFHGNTVVSVYDASLEYIAASTIPEIRSYFWNVRRYHHVSNVSTLNRMSMVMQKQGDIPMQPLFGRDPSMFGSGMMGGMGGVFGGGGGGRGGFGDPRFRGRMDRGVDSFMAAPSAAAGMVAESAAMGDGAPMALKAAAPGAPPSGGEPVQPQVRSSFADTAFWVASVDSDENGIVDVSFKVPDNLTTWKIKAWTLGDGTRVGSGDSDVISSKDLIIRPQTPRFFTEKDQITLSAVVHNYLATAKTTTVVLEAEGGQLRLMDGAEKVVSIPAGGEVRVDWNVQVMASGTAKVRMKALTDEESDASELSVPAFVHGLLKTESYTGVIRPGQESGTITVNVPVQRIEEQSRLEIRYSPSLAGAMVDALPYLIEYPYGCTEQTLNRFLPAVLTQRTLQNMGIDLEDVRNKRTNLNAQELGDPAERAAQWKRYQRNPVFDEAEMNVIVTQGLQALTDMQLTDGGWGWFSGYGEHSSAHLTSQVVYGLTIAERNNVPVLPDVIERGVEWLKTYQAAELVKLRAGDWRREHPKELDQQKAPFKMSADNLDAFVAYVLSQRESSDAAINSYLYRDRASLSVYAKALTGLVLHQSNEIENRDMVLRNIEQFLEQDNENETAWLRMEPNSWWYWYGSENEAMARYLQLLLKARPQDPTASRLVKYLLNNRKHGTYWNSTRDTALVVEAMSDYIAVTGEDRPNMTVEILIDGVVQKRVEIKPEDFFSFDSSLVLEGDAVTTGAHRIEIRKTGVGPLYFNAYLTNFSKEDQITAAGLEVKVDRKYYRLERDDAPVSVQGDRGQVVKQTTAKYKRVPLENLSAVQSGDLIEIEMLIESKNDYEYLMLEDRKPSGFEPDDQRSGYIFEGLSAYRELRDERVSFFLTNLARGKHSVSYRLRAEMPSQVVAALPAKIEGMYAPELVGNSDEFRLRVTDRPLVQE